MYNFFFFFRNQFFTTCKAEKNEKNSGIHERKTDTAISFSLIRIVDTKVLLIEDDHQSTV